MPKLFETKDKTGRIIYLTKERWIHISTEHPEAASFFKNFEDVLINPTKIISYFYNKNIKYYYKYFKEKKSYLLIIVKYLNGEGFIITSYFIKHIL